MTCVSVVDDLCVSLNRQPIDNLSPEERDARTVFCMQLAARIRPRDLEEFFSAVGKVWCHILKHTWFLFFVNFSPHLLILNDRYNTWQLLYPSFKVRDVRMISDRNSRRSKGIAYIEFVEATSVPLAIGLTGQRVLGVPIIVQASQVRASTQCKSTVWLLIQCMWIILLNCLHISGWEEQSRSHGQHAPERWCRAHAAVRGLSALQYYWGHAQGHLWAVRKGVVGVWNGFACISS